MLKLHLNNATFFLLTRLDEVSTSLEKTTEEQNHVQIRYMTQCSVE